MNNLHELQAVQRPDLESVIVHAIGHDCYRQVDKRLALKLALALLDRWDEGSIYFAYHLLSVLKLRIDSRLRINMRRA